MTRKEEIQKAWDKYRTYIHGSHCVPSEEFAEGFKAGSVRHLMNKQEDDYITISRNKIHDIAHNRCLEKSVTGYSKQDETLIYMKGYYKCIEDIFGEENDKNVGCLDNTGTITQEQSVSENYRISEESVHKNIDWEQRRYELAKDFTVGIISAHTVEEINNSFFKNVNGHKAVIDLSVSLADSLIKKLKGE